MTWDNAITMGLDHLYHYQPFDYDRLKNIIIENKIYLSSPKDFNDPWDCKPFWNLDDLDDANIRSRHIDWYEKAIRNNIEGYLDSEMQRNRILLNKNPELLKKLIENTSQFICSDIEENYRVYCLSKINNCELMWAHYSNKHTGVCLEFSTKNILFGGAPEVSYRKDYPKYDLTSTDELKNIEPFLTKSDAWKYEGEYRLVAKEDRNGVHKYMLYTQDNFLKIPDESLKSIIIGCMAPQSTIDEVKKLADLSPSSIRVMQTVKSHNKYALSPMEI